MEENESKITQTKKSPEPLKTEGSAQSAASAANKKSLVRSGISLSFLTLLSRILGLIREMTKAAFLGTSFLADAFTFAFQLPNLFRRLFAENSISVAFIPTFKSYLEQEQTDPAKKQETKEFLKATFTLISFLTTVFTLLGILLAPLITPFFTESTDPELVSEMAVLTRIMFPYLIVISIAAFFQGILNGMKIFAPSGFTPVLFNLIVILASYILSPYTANPARAMSIGVISGGAVQALFQLPFVLKNHRTVQFTTLKKAFTNPGTRKVLRLVAPTIFGMAAYQLNDLVSMWLAGNAGPGIQSSLSYSLRLQELILGIFAVSVGTVILPDLTSFSDKKLDKEFNDLLLSSIRIITLIAIPVTFFAMSFSDNIIRLVYKSKNFTEESVMLTNSAFLFHMTGLFFIAVNRIISPAFYAKKNTKSPTIAGIICFAANMAIAACLAKPFQGAGIALALSVASAINTIVLFIFMKKDKIADTAFMLKGTLLYVIRILIFSVVATIIPLLIKKPVFALFNTGNRFIDQGAPLVICGLAFAAVGVLMLVITKDPLLATVWRRFGRKSGK
ncbi:MAG: murein biosynthesis integral membrane protein MurJ [Treponemataceae bacterium]|nr:murein biosynthesis integral membrane protein MurJ [Treponemataceae bacterium]